jgi:hypothetical protein
VAHRYLAGRAIEALEPQGGPISLRPEEDAHLLQRSVWEVLGELWVSDAAVRIWASEIIAAHLYTAGFVVHQVIGSQTGA